MCSVVPPSGLVAKRRSGLATEDGSWRGPRVADERELLFAKIAELGDRLRTQVIDMQESVRGMLKGLVLSQVPGLSGERRRARESSSGSLLRCEQAAPAQGRISQSSEGE